MSFKSWVSGIFNATNKVKKTSAPAPKDWSYLWPGKDEFFVKKTTVDIYGNTKKNVPINNPFTGLQSLPQQERGIAYDYLAGKVRDETLSLSDGKAKWRALSYQSEAYCALPEEDRTFRRVSDYAQSAHGAVGQGAMFAAMRKTDRTGENLRTLLVKNQERKTDLPDLVAQFVREQPGYHSQPYYDVPEGLLQVQTQFTKAFHSLPQPREADIADYIVFMHPVTPKDDSCDRFYSKIFSSLREEDRTSERFTTYMETLKNTRHYKTHTHTDTDTARISQGIRVQTGEMYNKLPYGERLKEFVDFMREIDTETMHPKTDGIITLTKAFLDFTPEDRLNIYTNYENSLRDNRSKDAGMRAESLRRQGFLFAYLDFPDRTNDRYKAYEAKINEFKEDNQNYKNGLIVSTGRNIAKSSLPATLRDAQDFRLIRVGTPQTYDVPQFPPFPGPSSPPLAQSRAVSQSR